MYLPSGRFFKKIFNLIFYFCSITIVPIPPPPLHSVIVPPLYDKIVGDYYKIVLSQGPFMPPFHSGFPPFSPLSNH